MLCTILSFETIGDTLKSTWAKITVRLNVLDKKRLCKYYTITCMYSRIYTLNILLSLFVRLFRNKCLNRMILTCFLCVKCQNVVHVGFFLQFDWSFCKHVDN